MKILTNLCIVIFCCTWSFSAGQEVEEDGVKMIPAEPLSVVPPPPQKSGPEVSPQGSQPNQGIYGTRQETKNSDGSTTSITHFKGSLPPDSFVGSHPHSGFFPGWGFPQAGPFFYNPGGYNNNPYNNPWGPSGPFTPSGIPPPTQNGGPQNGGPQNGGPQNAAPQNARSIRAVKSKQGEKSSAADEQASQLVNTSSLPFSKRFPAPPRVSNAFHYPARPDVYWQTHKKPFVPLIDPEVYGHNEVEEEV